MKIAFPIDRDSGLDSMVYSHFGSASFFVIGHTEKGFLKTIANTHKEHPHGQCQPMTALGGEPVDAIVAGGIGGGALRKLNLEGIRVYRAIEGTVEENLRLAKLRSLPEITPDQTCAGHGPHKNCIH